MKITNRYQLPEPIVRAVSYGAHGPRHRERLCDYKYTSVWAIIKGRSEWEKQLNLYAELLRRNGFPVRWLAVVPLLYDWRKDDAAEREDYPPAPAFVYHVPLWEQQRAAADLCGRVVP